MSITTLNPVALELDASGLNCPLPILKTRKAVKELASGEVLKVRATDPGSLQDMASFCTQTGHDLLSTREEDGVYEFLIRKN